MYICICHAVTDCQIKEFAQKNGRNWRKLTAELKVGTKCGSCAKRAKQIHDQSAKQGRSN